MDNLNTLIQLSEAFGPSGFEEEVNTIISNEFNSLNSFKRTVDGLGSVIFSKHNDSSLPVISLVAHMDEIGYLVKYVDDNGFIKVQNLGGWLSQAMINQRWIIRTDNKDIIGISGIKTIHVMTPEERRGFYKTNNELFIDIGAKNKNDAIDIGIKPGNPIAPYSKVVELKNDRLLGKAWDDRIGCAMLIDLAKKVDDITLPYNINFVFTTQEEIGLRGAMTTAYITNSDICINLEVGVAGDFPYMIKDEAQEELGLGPSIFLHDSSMLPDKNLQNYIERIAFDNGINLQYEVLAGYGEDGAMYQKSRKGIPAINLGIPTRYLHSHNSVIDLNDYSNGINLVDYILNDLNQDKINSIIN
ncbi:MAG: M42 family metallopeptidase [SAR202 cluster bacterium]|nr:M42 family metallopeptidase [SAR202 cluster bacterium]